MTKVLELDRADSGFSLSLDCWRKWEPGERTSRGNLSRGEESGDEEGGI